ncbi:MAG: hypothetical protein WCZ89_05180 [Phycisphaerae bacterium]
MIKNRKKLEDFEKQQLIKEQFSYKDALAIYESLFHEAVSLGAISSKNIMDGFEVNIRIAKALNSLK